MIEAKKSSWKKGLLLVVKLLVVAAALVYLYQKVADNNDFGSISAYFAELLRQPSTYLLGLAALLLMPINWGIEAYKWRFLIGKLERVPMPRAMKAVFSGLTLSTFTPNRIGDYAGRVFHLENASRGQATLVTFLGNIGQLVMTLVLGILAFSGIVWKFEFPAALASGTIGTLLTVAAIAGTVLIVWLYVRTPRYTDRLGRLPVIRRFERYHSVLNRYNPLELVVVLFLAMVRYGVFSLQYFLLLQLFEVELSVLEGLLLIPATFLVMTAIPTIALTELGVREVVALQFFTLASTNDLGIIAATFALWAINLGLPALVGSLFVLSYQPFKTATQ